MSQPIQILIQQKSCGPSLKEIEIKNGEQYSSKSLSSAINTAVSNIKVEKLIKSMN